MPPIFTKNIKEKDGHNISLLTPSCALPRVICIKLAK